MAFVDAMVWVGERAPPTAGALAHGTSSRPGSAARDEGLGRRREVTERAVRAHGVVVAPPRLDQDLGFGQAEEHLAIEQLVTKLAVEALAVAVLQGLPGSM